LDKVVAIIVVVGVFIVAVVVDITPRPSANPNVWMFAHPDIISFRVLEIVDHDTRFAIQIRS